MISFSVFRLILLFNIFDLEANILMTIYIPSVPVQERTQRELSWIIGAM